MKEVQFIRQNIDKWREAETLAEGADSAAPDDLADAYIDVTSDLSFAQTHYPDSKIRLYLNALASALHNEIYRYKREPWTRLLTFWTQEVPDTVWRERRCLLASLCVFLISVVIGVVSQCLDADFARIILGDHYVDMTLDNIAMGKPMNVYDGDPESEMFVLISNNNIRVSFLTFALGILTSLGPGFILFQNGVMVGTFQTFFVQHSLFFQSALSIWLHGTIEMTTLVMTGAGGIAMGNGLLFPGTYSRLRSLRQGAKRGLRIVVGVVPLVILAGFIESFMTRHVEWPEEVRLSVITASALFVVFYFIYLPYKRNHGKESVSTLQGAHAGRED